MHEKAINTCTLGGQISRASVYTYMVHIVFAAIFSLYLRHLRSSIMVLRFHSDLKSVFTRHAGTLKLINHRQICPRFIRFISSM